AGDALQFPAQLGISLLKRLQGGEAIAGGGVRRTGGGERLVGDRDGGGALRQQRLCSGRLLREVALGAQLAVLEFEGRRFGAALCAIFGDQFLRIANRLQSEEAADLTAALGLLQVAEEGQLLLPREKRGDEGTVVEPDQLARDVVGDLPRT